VLLVIRETFGAEQSPQHKNTGNANFQQGQSLIFSNPFNELVSLLDRPIIGSSEIVVIPFGELFSEGDHAPNDPGGIAHDGVSTLSGRGVERVDDICLEIDNGLRQLKMFGEIRIRSTLAGGVGGV